MKKSIAIFMAFMLMFLLVACSGDKTTQDDKQSSETTQAQADSVNVKEYGFNSMDAYDESLKLTDDQRTALSFYNDNYIQVNQADSLIRSPKYLRGMKMTFELYVQKILESDDNTYTIVGEIIETFSEQYQPTDYNKSIVIKGSQTDQRFMVDDIILCDGIYKDIESYTVDGISYQFPTIEVVDFDLLFGEGDLDESLDKAAKAIFSNDVTTREPKEGIDFEVDDIHGYSYFRLVEFPSGKQEDSFEIYSEEHRVVKKGSTYNNYVTLKPAADFKNYYFFTENLSSNTGKIELVSSDFEPVWSKEITDTTNFYIDYNRKTVMYLQGSDLYIVNAKDGKDAVEAVYVGERNNLVMTNDGCAILVGTGENDNIIKVDTSGKILWRASVPLSVSYCNSIQIQSDGSAIIALTDESGSIYSVKVETDGTFNDPILVYYYSEMYY